MEAIGTTAPMQGSSTVTTTIGLTLTTTRAFVQQTNLQDRDCRRNTEENSDYLTSSLKAQIMQNRASTSTCSGSLSYEEIISLDNLLEAYLEAVKGKSNRYKYQNYSENLAINLHRLHKSLVNGSYRPKQPIPFDVFCISGQKVRHINAPYIDDLIVQHAVYRKIYPLFEKEFIYDSYGCRKNKGTHRAADRCHYFVRHSPAGSYYLQMDIRKYYYSIPHDKLKLALQRKLKDKRIVDLIMVQFENNVSKIGLNVGALLSQVMGLIFLDYLDHFIKRVLKVKRYIRYVDDFVCIGLTKQECIKVRDEVTKFLFNKQGLTLSKALIRPLKRGINFAGFRTFRTKRVVRKRSLHVFFKSVRKHKYKSIQSSLAHARNTSNFFYYMHYLFLNYDFNQINRFDRTYYGRLTKYKLDKEASSFLVPNSFT